VPRSESQSALTRYRVVSVHGASVVVVVDEVVLEVVELVVLDVLDDVVEDVDVELVGGIVDPGGDVVTTDPFDCAPAGAIDNT